MALTRANVESILLRRCGTTLEKAGLNYQTEAGDNEDLNDPIGYAVRLCGGTVSSAAEVTDTDVATVATEDTDAFLDVAEYRLLETVYNTVLDLVDTTSGPQRQNLSQWAAAIAAKVQRLEAKIADRYDIDFGGTVITSGVVDLDFMEKDQ